MGNYHKKKGKVKSPIFCGNRKQVIPVYGGEVKTLARQSDSEKGATDLLGSKLT